MYRAHPTTAARPLVAAAILLALIAPGVRAAADRPCPLEFDQWTTARARKDAKRGSNLFDLQFEVTNTGDKTLHSTVFQMELYEALGRKIKTLRPSAPVTIPAGESRRVHIADSFVPVFDSYVLNVRSSRDTWRLLGSGELAAPVAEEGHPIPNQAYVAILGHTFKTQGKTTVVRARLRNFGEKKAEDVKVQVTLFDRFRNIVGQLQQKVRNPKQGNAAVLAADEETIVTLVLRNKPFYALQLKATTPEIPAEELLSGGEFSDQATVEVAKVKFDREDKTLNVTAMARNGLDAPIEQLKITFKFLKNNKVVGRKTYEVPGLMESGARTQFRFSVPDLPQIDGYETALSMQEVRPQTAGEGDVEVPLAGGVKKGEVYLQVTQALLEDGKLILEGNAGNGLDKDAKKIKVTFALMKGDKQVKTSVASLGELGAGKQKPFTVTIDDPPAFESYQYSINYAVSGK